MGRTRRALCRSAVGIVAGVGGAGCVGDRPATFLALGDSYTVGTSVASEDRWADRLPDELAERGIDLDQPRIVAEGGWQTTDLAVALDARAGTPESEDEPPILEEAYDLVTLCIGANDAFQERPPEEFKPDFRSLLDRAIGLADGRPGRVLVMTIPDYTVTPLGRRQLDDDHADRLLAYNEIISALANDRDTRLVDLVPPSRRVRDDPSLVEGDDLHPSPKQYGLWLDRIVPAAAAALEDERL